MSRFTELFPHEEDPPDLDLGLDHWLSFTTWSPDRSLPQPHGHLPDTDRLGAQVFHLKPDGSACWGHIHFEGEVQKAVFPKYATWKVESWDPLTISPSLQCMIPECKDHGFIREGRWVKA